jgi:hypothetical protein
VTARWYAVRCCCQPTKLLGWIRLPTEAEERRAWTALSRRDGPTYVELKRLTDEGVSEVAVYSDDRPIEFWRTVDGFRENTSDGELAVRLRETLANNRVLRDHVRWLMSTKNVERVDA